MSDIRDTNRGIFRFVRVLRNHAFSLDISEILDRSNEHTSSRDLQSHNMYEYDFNCLTGSVINTGAVHSQLHTV